MPSAGRAFSSEVIGRLAAKDIRLVPLVLHTAVSSPEWDEPLCDEYYSIPIATAELINQTRLTGRRIVAVGTSTLRALETAADEHGQVEATSGWTSLLLSGARGCRAVDGLLTGFHEARASHIGILESIAHRHHLELAYEAALGSGYLWHEFGDLHLILRG
jgi:S-adenosylmethionine:tRNA ribosyltransferase-isomerase